MVHRHCNCIPLPNMLCVFSLAISVISTVNWPIIVRDSRDEVSGRGARGGSLPCLETNALRWNCQTTSNPSPTQPSPAQPSSGQNRYVRTYKTKIPTYLPTYCTYLPTYSCHLPPHRAANPPHTSYSVGSQGTHERGRKAIRRGSHWEVILSEYSAVSACR